MYMYVCAYNYTIYFSHYVCYITLCICVMVLMCCLPYDVRLSNSCLKNEKASPFSTDIEYVSDFKTLEILETADGVIIGRSHWNEIIVLIIHLTSI